MGKHILIVGPGYVGEPLARSLADAGCRITVASRSGKEVSACRALTLDLADRDAVNAAAGELEKVEAIVHCASSSRGGVDSYRAVYLEGAKNLSRALPGVPLFFTSSTSVYPQTDGEEVTESSPANPDSETGGILREAEDAVLENGGCVLRLSGIYGPGRSIHLKRIFEGKAQIESGEPSRLLNQIHRDDIVSAIVHLLHADPVVSRGEIYNVSDSRSLTMRECYEWLAGRFGKSLGPETEPNRSGKRAWTNKDVNNHKLRATGWTPSYPTFKDAVKNDPDLVASIRTMTEPSS